MHYFQDLDFKSEIAFWKFLAQIPKFRHFGPKSIDSLILSKFRMYPVSNVLISDLTLLQTFWAQITKYGYFASKSFNFLALTKFCPQSISKVLISNPTFVFKNLELKSPNIWPKSANFYIVTKFPLSAISHVLISNLTFAVCGS